MVDLLAFLKGPSFDFDFNIFTNGPVFFRRTSVIIEAKNFQFKIAEFLNLEL